ncbi:hypothetical protein NM208_g5774 [Fusarium decemcellulare]|uniref:Uncharacterized protein n=1 Tax=Fusarium decemcellulare TaxID=57161 RepID=A0ACC1SFM9_9HYPO|nr:hypothetical protein NM208_g5774 [Fusarium decemcellulare]
MGTCTSSTSEEAFEDLHEDVAKATKDSVFNGNPSFVPESSINKLLDQSRVRKIVPDIDQRLQDWVYTDAPKIFLILQKACFPHEIRKYLQRLRDGGLADKNLPLQDIQQTGRCTRFEAETCTHPSDHDIFHDIKMWPARVLGGLLDNQWKFTAHVFQKGADRAELASKCILPFISKGTEKSGTFGTVCEVGLHGDHIEQGALPEEVVVNGTKVSTGCFQLALKQLHDVPEDPEYKVEKAWELEANALFTTRSLNSPHLVRIIGAFKQSQGQGQGKKYFLLLEWAQGGNLRDFWLKNGMGQLRHDQVRQYLQQMLGLCQALEELHKDGPPDNGENLLSAPGSQQHNGEGHIRHGDVKAANILIFPEEVPEKLTTWPGVLKIADLGLAKSHFEQTALRTQETKTKAATRQYLAPEMAINTKQKRSRRFDIWSMGCIIFESVLWFLYGGDGLEKFWAMSAQLQNPEKDSLFFSIVDPRKSLHPGTGGLKAEVSKIFLDLAAQIEGQDRSRQRPPTVIGDLLTLVRDKLLIVEPKSRSTARQLREELQKIISRANNSKYLATTERRSTIELPIFKSSPMDSAYHGQQLDNSWEVLDDHDFVHELFQADPNLVQDLLPSRPTHLCARCSQLDISSNDFTFADRISGLKTTASACGLCRLLLDTLKTNQTNRVATKDAEITVRKTGSELIISGTGANFGIPTLSLCRTLDTNMELQDIKIGLPRLLTPGTPTSLGFIRRWIVNCDKNHPECNSHISPALNRLPTRLIDVGGEQGADKIYLHEVSLEDRKQPEYLKYIALSHRWGDEKLHEHFSTTTDNVSSRQGGIPVNTLPGTFRDAVKITRQLGVRYLWIDSICIIQKGDLCDFETEAKHMETVFHLAYAVIAASRVTGTSDGFLSRRPERKFVTVPTSSGHSVFVCENIDNFQHEIVEGEMNKRGWVLQERALARRTIYFGGIQTYWECGEGVRCETLTKMRNNKEGFLGDPNFPTVAINSTKGGRIRLVESLYKQYSTLEFKRDYDRPLAIAGLEQRLIRAFDTKGGYGVFERYLGRTVLWKRGSRTALKKIDFPPNQDFKVPSWSWMAYSGAIDFVNAPFDKVDWSEDLGSPWASASPFTSSTGDSTSSNVLHAKARGFDQGTSGSQVVYDSGAPSARSTMKCVVVGKEKQEDSADRTQQRHFVLIVMSRPAARKPDEYVRIGAGVLPTGSIDLDGAGLNVKIS